MEKVKVLSCAAKTIAALFMFILFSGNAMSQIKVKREYKSQKRITSFDNTTFCTTFMSDGSLYALRDIPILDDSDVDKVVFNPTGSSLALMRGTNNITIYSFIERNTLLFELKEQRKSKELKGRKTLPFTLPGESGAKLMKSASKGKIVPVAMCYSADARNFIASNSLGEIIIYDTKTYMPQSYIQTKNVATSLAMSANNYFIAAAGGKTVDIWNFQTKELRKSIPMVADVKEVTFSADASMMAALVGDSHLIIYDTKTWEPLHDFGDMGGMLASISFHPDGKYLSMVQNRNLIVVMNLKKNELELSLNEKPGGVVGSRFFMNNRTSDVFMLSNRATSMVFWDANGLNPFFGKLVSKEVDAKMNEWVKMMQGESMEDYAIRVNDETRLKQQQLFTQEAATALAGDRISIDNPFVGEYDASKNMLNIGFEALPAITLEVPAGEVGEFGNGKNLKFDNAVYVLNDKDEFELAYVEVRNETTNKVYIYDNIGRTRLTALEDDANFVPLEIMQQASREEIQLKEIKEAVVEEKKQDKLITENTQINVMTEVVPGVDANGNKVLNYKVGYQYEVINKEFSAKEDFPSGGYDIARSNAAMSLMKIIKNAFEGDFSKYLSEGKQVKVVITGSADASPIRGRIAYNEQYGRFVNEPYYKDGNIDNITVTKESGITANEQLALMRAAGVKNYIENNVTTLNNTKNEYQYNVEVAAERGGEFRKINVEFVIMDAFPVN